MNLPSLKNLFLSQQNQQPKKNLYGGLFNPNQGGINPQAVASQPMVQEPDPMSVSDAGEGQALSAYRKYLQSMPQRGNNTMMQKIVAALAGASTAYKQGAGAGLEATQNYLDLPYAKNMQSWLAQGEGLKNAASLEGQSQGRENTALRNAMNFQLGQEKNKTTRYGIDKRSEMEIAKLEANKSNITAKLDANRYQFTGETNDAGNPIIFDRTTSNTFTAKDVDMFSDKEKLDAQLANSRYIVQVQQAGANSRNAATNAQSDTNSVRASETSKENTQARIQAGQNLLDDKQQFTLENPVVGNTKPNATYEKYQDQNTIRDLAIAHPEWVGNIIKQLPTGGLIVVPPDSGGFFGSNKDSLAAIQQFKKEYDAKKKSTGLPTLAKPNTNNKSAAASSNKLQDIATITNPTAGQRGLYNGKEAVYVMNPQTGKLQWAIPQE